LIRSWICRASWQSTNTWRPCEACKTIFVQHFALQSGIRKHAVYYTAPDTLKERIRGMIGRSVTATPANGVKPRWQQPRFQRFQLVC